MTVACTVNRQQQTVTQIAVAIGLNVDVDQSIVAATIGIDSSSRQMIYDDKIDRECGTIGAYLKQKVEGKKMAHRQACAT